MKDKKIKPLVVDQTYYNYCIDCPFYEEELSSNKIYCDGALRHTTYEIKCKNEDLCTKLIEYLEPATKY